MAVDIGNKKVRVVKGDTLWSIASKYTGNPYNYQKIATLNGIPNPDRIYVGQVISYDLSGSASSSGSSSSNKASTDLYNLKMGELASNEGTLYAFWNCNATYPEAKTKEYQLEWRYAIDGIWFITMTSVQVNEHNYEASRQTTWNIPSGATSVKLRVKAVAKEKESTGTSTKKTYEYSNASWSKQLTWSDLTPLETPKQPSISIEKYELTAELDGLDDYKAKQIQFEVWKVDGTQYFKQSDKINISATKNVSYTCTVDPGTNYKVRCKAYDGTLVSEWSSFSTEDGTPPSAPAQITDIKATSKTSIYIQWEKVNNAEKYEIQYVTKEEYFESSNQSSSPTSTEDATNHITFYGLETGQEYFFRVRAVNDKGQSPWCEPKSIVIGEKPAAPTTWSSSTTVIVGEPLTLFWVHNTVDGSSQEYAELNLVIDGIEVKPDITIRNTTDEDEKDKISQCSFDTKTGIISWTVDGTTHTVSTGCSPIEGMEIKWRVRTVGISNEPSDWSVQRTIDLYAPPTLDLRVLGVKTTTNQNGEIEYGPDENNPISVVETFPFYVYALPGPNTQHPIGYHVSVRANEAYTSIDQIGNEQNINKDQEIYSKYFDIKDSLLVEFTPGNIDLESGITYTVQVTVTMNSGLTSEASKELDVSWADIQYTPNAEIAYDTEKYVTHIRPYCEDHKNIWYKVENTSKTYAVTTELIDETALGDVYTDTGETVKIGINTSNNLVYYCVAYVDSNGNSINPTYYRVTESTGMYTRTATRINSSTISTVRTLTGEEVYLGVIGAGEPFFYAVIDETSLVEGITLSVYRREFDGEFTEIATGIDNTKHTFTTDPHPALDYARYRIVAVVNSTGAISYYDVPGFPINEVGAIIQWEEDWSEFDTDIDYELAQPPWTGSLLRIPYNIDVSDSNTPDVSLVNYVGRKRPVTYYGTHLGEKSSWSMEIPKDDKDTLYAIRRLQLWMGDVYVREPSGSGYWANITVSYNQNHGDVTIPVSMSITRVEGGV